MKLKKESKELDRQMRITPKRLEKIGESAYLLCNIFKEQNITLENAEKIVNNSEYFDDLIAFVKSTAKNKVFGNILSKKSKKLSEQNM